ncbi:unnamed protein product [Mytilus edulis]|uniref:LRP5_6 n=1 Tax=Mytilus edulis TaxID=6550 RepID=A0A8S3TUB6_MYTED|nr:unnamed protein product [Mytilus edulis]
MEFDIDTGNVTVLLEQSENVYAMDYDYKNRFIYFPRYNTHDIVRFAYPSKNTTLQTVIQSLSGPTGIAVDPTNGHIYWTDYNTNRLSRCNLDGNNVNVLSSLNSPLVIRLDLTNRWIYIVERFLGILKSRFDVAKQQNIVNSTSAPVDSMDIDTNEHRLYWINGEGDITSSKDDGSDVKTIHSTNVTAYYYAIGVVGSYIYYGNAYNQLLMVSKTPGSAQTVLYNDTSRIYSIFVLNSPGMSITIFSMFDDNLRRKLKRFFTISY